VFIYLLINHIVTHYHFQTSGDVPTITEQTIFDLQFYERLKTRKFINCETLSRSDSLSPQHYSADAQQWTTLKIISFVATIPLCNILVDAIDGELPWFGCEGFKAVGGHFGHDGPGLSGRIVEAVPPANQGQKYSECF